MDLLKRDNGYIVVSGFKGIWTLNEVIELLHHAGLKVRIVMTKGDDRIIERDDSLDQVIEGR
jgi:hypothetical protein